MEPIREALATLPDAVFADFLESSEAYRLVLDVPGVDEDGLTLEATGTTVSIEARRSKSVPAGFEYQTDARSMVLDTTIPMPPDAEPEDTTASLEQGVLTVDVPKTASSGQSIPIEG